MTISDKIEGLDLADRLEAEARGPFVETTDRNLYAQAASTIRSLVEERDAYRKRLEIDVAYQLGEDGELVEVPAPAGMPDGIECRDATIQFQDETKARLKARVTELEGVLRPFAALWDRLSEDDRVRRAWTFETRVPIDAIRKVSSALSTSSGEEGR